MGPSWGEPAQGKFEARLFPRYGNFFRLQLQVR